MDPISSAQMPPGSDLLSILALGSTALSSIGALGQGFANSSLAQFQASIANFNAQMLTQQAGMQAKEGQLSLDEGALQQSRIANTVSQTIGAETGKFAASNLNPAYGSPLVLEGFTAGQGETDEALAGAQASMGYAGALQQSASTLTQAASQTGPGRGVRHAIDQRHHDRHLRCRHQPAHGAVGQQRDAVERADRCGRKSGQRSQQCYEQPHGGRGLT